jgi:hypothetical protein
MKIEIKYKYKYKLNRNEKNRTVIRKQKRIENKKK